MKNNGFLFAVLSSLFVSTSFVFVQYLLKYIPPEFLMVLWFLSASAMSAGIVAFYKKENPISYFRRNWKEGLVLGFINFLSALTWTFSIQLIGSSLSSFLMRLTTIFMILIGILFLKEKLSAIELIGAIIAIAGAFLISFNSESIILIGVAIAVGSALFSAIHDTIAKAYVSKIDPIVMASIRTAFSFFFLTLYATSLSRIMVVPTKLIPFIIIGSTMSAVIGYIFYFLAMQRMDISKVAIIRTLDPFVVLIYAFIIFRTLPTTIELIGGILIVSGVIISELEIGKAIGNAARMMQNGNIFK